MRNVKIIEIKFSSFIKLACFIALSIGIIFGLLMFFRISLFSVYIKTNTGLILFHGVPAGIAAIVVGPIIFVIFGLIIGILGYLPFKLMLKFLKGITLNVKLEDTSDIDVLEQEKMEIEA